MAFRCYASRIPGHEGVYDDWTDVQALMTPGKSFVGNYRKFRTPTDGHDEATVRRVAKAWSKTQPMNIQQTVAFTTKLIIVTLLAVTLLVATNYGSTHLYKNYCVGVESIGSFPCKTALMLMTASVENWEVVWKGISLVIVTGLYRMIHHAMLTLGVTSA